jgi:DNA mismatch repair protein MutS
VSRAREILNGLERDELSRGGRPSLSGAGVTREQPGLFEAPAAADDAVRRRLREIDVNQITPLQALSLLAELKDAAGD